MSLRKIESIKIEFQPNIVKSKKVKVILTEDEKAYLREVKKEMEVKIKECRKEIEAKIKEIKAKKDYIKTENINITHYRKEFSRKLGILTPKQLHDMKRTYSSGKYHKILQKNIDKAKQRDKLVKNYIKTNHPEIEKLQAEIKELQSKIEELEKNIEEIQKNVKQQHENAWHIFGETKYQEVTEMVKNEHPYYIMVVWDGSKFFIPGTSGDYYLPILKEKYLISPLEEYITRYKNGEQIYIIRLNNEGLFYLYGNNIYKSNRPYTNEQLSLLILELEDKERRKFERLKHKFSLSQEEIKKRREKIPENVRIAVWRRDEGRCVRCGSQKNLEYDHIIPVSKGGSNTERNIQILCEKCNREKSDKI